MDDSFEIPVNLNGSEHSFSARLVPSGYVHKILVDVYGEQIYFEPDEEGAYRAVTDIATLDNSNDLSVELLREIALTIQNARS